VLLDIIFFLLYFYFVFLQCDTIQIMVYFYAIIVLSICLSVCLSHLCTV